MSLCFCSGGGQDPSLLIHVGPINQAGFHRMFQILAHLVLARKLSQCYTKHAFRFRLRWKKSPIEFSDFIWFSRISLPSPGVSPFFPSTPGTIDFVPQRCGKCFGGFSFASRPGRVMEYPLSDIFLLEKMSPLWLSDYCCMFGELMVGKKKNWAKSCVGCFRYIEKYGRWRPESILVWGSEQPCLKHQVG